MPAYPVKEINGKKLINFIAKLIAKMPIALLRWRKVIKIEERIGAMVSVIVCKLEIINTSLPKSRLALPYMMKYIALAKRIKAMTTGMSR